MVDVFSEDIAAPVQFKAESEQDNQVAFDSDDGMYPLALRRDQYINHALEPLAAPICFRHPQDAHDAMLSDAEGNTLSSGVSQRFVLILGNRVAAASESQPGPGASNMAIDSEEGESGRV